MSVFSNHCGYTDLCECLQNGDQWPFWIFSSKFDSRNGFSGLKLVGNDILH